MISFLIFRYGGGEARDGFLLREKLTEFNTHSARRVRRQPRKKKHSLHFCFGGGGFLFEKGKGVFLSGFLSSKYSDRRSANAIRTRQSKTIFAGGKGFALPRLILFGGIPAAQEGAGGMRGGFGWRKPLK